MTRLLLHNFWQASKRVFGAAKICVKAMFQKSAAMSFYKKLFVRFSVKEQIIFAKRLALLVRADVPILESLRILQRGRMKLRAEVLDKIIEDVEQGRYLYVSMSRFGHIFGDFAINIVKVGEAGGILEQSLDYWAEELKKKYVLRRKILSALVYPLFIMAATLGLTAMLLVFVLPKVMPIFASLQIRLPFATSALLFVSVFLVNYGIYFLLAIVLLVVLFIFLKNRWGRFALFCTYLLVRVPLFGAILQECQMVHFCRTVGLLLKSGVKINDALSILVDTTKNAAYQKEYRRLLQAVDKGKSIAEELEKNTCLFPGVATQMIAVGERVGELSDTLLFLAEMHEQEVNEMTKNLSGALEPVLMVFMGVIVGFVAVAIIAPIYEITSNLSPQ